MRKAPQIIMLLQNAFLLRRLLIITVVIISSCSTTIYNIYTPNNESLFNFEFEYPASWGSMQDDRAFESISVFTDGIRIKDPSKPVPDCPFSDSILIRQFGCDTRPTILLHAYEIGPSPRWADDRINTTREAILAINQLELISDRVLSINGYEAQAITFTFDNSILQTTTTSIAIQVDDRGYILVINYLTEEDLEGAFHQAFWNIIESIQFIPQSTE